MFIYSVKFICGTQNALTDPQACSSVRQGIYATDINIHNFNRDQQAVIEKRALPLVQNDKPVGREPAIAKATVFDKITLPPDTATMDDCCVLNAKLALIPNHLSIGFLEVISTVEVNIVAVYTVTDLKSVSVSIDVETIAGRKV